MATAVSTKATRCARAMSRTEAIVRGRMGSSPPPRTIEVVPKLRPADCGDELGGHDRPECEDDSDPDHVVGQALNRQPPARPVQDPHTRLKWQLVKSAAYDPIHPRCL